MRVYLLGFMMIFLLPAFAVTARTIPDTEAGCMAQNGKWQSQFTGGTMEGSKYCFLPVKDKGKPCSSKSDCMDICIAKGEADKAGTCGNRQETILNGGYEIDQNGVAQPLPVM